MIVNRNHSILLVAMIVTVSVMAATTGCATLGDSEEIGDPEALQKEARDFHSNLRWARYQHAYDAVHPAYRGTIEGKFEERGEDYEIVEMTMKGLEMRDGTTAHVQVEQKWYELPSTVVESERFIERWIYEDEHWQLRERLRRDVFRDRGESFDSESDSTEEEDGPAGP